MTCEICGGRVIIPGRAALFAVSELNVTDGETKKESFPGMGEKA